MYYLKKNFLFISFLWIIKYKSFLINKYYTYISSSSDKESRSDSSDKSSIEISSSSSS